MTKNKRKQSIIFACSLTSKKHHFDGERRKSQDILNVLKSVYKVSVCDFTKNRYIQIIKFIFLCFFNRKRFVFIAKAPTGGNIMLKILKKMKYPAEKIAFYLYGKGLMGGFYESRVDVNNLRYPKYLICESLFIKEDFIKRGFLEEQIKIFPCIKKIVEVNIPDFEKKEILSGIFISRIVKAKGVLDLLDALKIINKNKIKFKATISGGWPEPDTEEKIIEESKKRNDIVYLGQSFAINTKEDYDFLSSFDLHFFPTKFAHEGIPGSAIDAFIAGLPSLVSTYDCAREVFSNETAYFFEYDSVEDMVRQMDRIYSNQKELYLKRHNCLIEAKKYSERNFEIFIKDIIKE